MANEIICIVDTDPTQSPDYTSLAAAIAGESGGSPKCVTGSDLVSNDEQLTIVCRASNGDADTETVMIEGFTTDATRFVKIVVDPDHRHQGAWDDTKYRIIPSTSQYRSIGINNNYTEVHGAQAQNDTYDTSVCVFDFRYDVIGKFVDCLAKNTRYDSDNHQIGFCFRYSTNQKAINCLAFGFKGGTNTLTSGFLFYRLHSDSNASAYNCVAYDCKYGFATDEYDSVAGKSHVYNCIALDSEIVDFYDEVAFGTSDNNISSDTSAPGTAYLHNQNSSDLFVNPSGGDFYPKPGSNAIDFGMDLSAWMDALDIVGTARPQGDNWDVGIFERILVTAITLNKLTATGTAKGLSVIPGSCTVSLDKLSAVGSIKDLSLSFGETTIPLDALSAFVSIKEITVHEIVIEIAIPFYFHSGLKVPAFRSTKVPAFRSLSH